VVSEIYGAASVGGLISPEPRGELVFEQACRMGLEGIVSKRLSKPYQSGPSRHLAEDQEPGEPCDGCDIGRGVGSSLVPVPSLTIEQQLALQMLATTPNGCTYWTLRTGRQPDGYG
jgi:hypothetical protein